MKERGIIFKGWGVRAIRNMVPDVWPPKAIDPALPIKWQTRRTRGLDEINKRPDDWRFEGWSSLKEGVALFGDMAASEPTQIEIKCPYGIEGDGLWVRETWGIIHKHNEPRIIYRADKVGALLGAVFGEDFKWKPSIHLHRRNSREDLVVKEVRVERAQEISPGDVVAEGIGDIGIVPGMTAMLVTGTTNIDDAACVLHRDMFAELWDEINGAGAWERNDYSWVLSYMRKGK